MTGSVSAARSRPGPPLRSCPGVVVSYDRRLGYGWIALIDPEGEGRQILAQFFEKDCDGDTPPTPGARVNVCVRGRRAELVLVRSHD